MKSYKELEERFNDFYARQNWQGQCMPELDSFGGPSWIQAHDNIVDIFQYVHYLRAERDRRDGLTAATKVLANVEQDRFKDGPL